MDILNTENAIIDRLKDKVPDLMIEGTPIDIEAYIEQFKHPKGAILVQYGGSKFEGPEDYNDIIQAEKPSWTMTLFTRNLRTHHGAYGYIESIKTALTGYLIPGLSKLYLSEIVPLGQADGGIFMYGLTFALNTTHEEA